MEYVNENVMLRVVILIKMIVKIFVLKDVPRNELEIIFVIKNVMSLPVLMIIKTVFKMHVLCDVRNNLQMEFVYKNVT